MVRELSLGNGSMLVNLDNSLRVRDLYFPYAGLENHVLGKAQRIGVHGRGFSWLEEWDTSPGYKKETIVSSSEALNELEELKINFESCVQCDERIFMRKIEVENLSSDNRKVELFFEEDYNLNGDNIGDTSFFYPDENSLVHYKRKRYLMANLKKKNGSCRDYKQYGIYGENPENDIKNGKLNENPISQGEVKSVFSIELELAPESKETFYFWISAGKNLDEVSELSEEIKPKIEKYFEETEMCWRGHLGALKHDLSILEDHIEEELKRSILIITGQSNENGAITAANDSENLMYNQDKYGYMWPRDGALVAETMTKAGYPELAENFFDFVEDVIRPEGFLMHKYHPDKSLGSSWHAWVDEEGEKRLPIQEDETALVLWAMKQYLDETGNFDEIEKRYGSLIRPAADFIYEYFDEDLGLPRPSYDLWEEKHYISTFTVASVYAALNAAAELSEAVDKDGSKYRARAETIKNKGLEKLRSEETKRYGRGLESGELLDEVSAPLFFLEKFGLADKDDEYYENTMEAIEHDLSPDTEIGGIARYKKDYYHNVTEDFDRVPGNPWIICTLWVAQHKITEAKTLEDLDEAKKLIHWTCENALDTGLLPEQVDPFTGEGKSVAPLTWSHSTYIETSLIYAAKKEELRSKSVL